ncbi:hypothetical protein Tco_0943266 [Tanacetum coccineum]
MERAATTASSLEAEHDTGNINRTQSMATLNESIPHGTDSGSGPRCQDTILRGAEAQISMKLKELMELCTKLSERILDIKTDRVNWLNLLLPVLVYVARHSPTAVRHKLMMPGITSYYWSRRKQRKDCGQTKPIPDEATNEEHVATHSCDPPQSGEDRMQLTELMDLCTQLQSRVLALETTKSNQALEIESLKRRVKSLEKRKKSRILGFKRLRKVGSASRVESSNDVSLGAQEDASKQGRRITDLDADAEVNLVDETQEMNYDNLMFDTGVLEEREIEFEKVVEELIVSVTTTTKSVPVSVADPVTTGGEVVTTASALTTTIDELTLAQTLKEIKAAKPKAVTSAATTTTITRPKARRDVVKEPSEFKTTSSPSQASKLPQAKDKGKSKMVEPEKPLKKKDQIAIDEEVARNLEAQLQAELEEEERISRLKEEEANIALLES